MSKIYRLVSSVYLTVFLFLIFIIAQIYATFLPTETLSFRYIYDTAWFQGILWILGVNLLLVIARYKTYRKIPVFVLHLAIIVILIGAAVTKYFGFKGMLHLRDNQTKSTILIKNRENPNDIKVKNIGFSVKLDKFVIKRYPGSMQPSSYDSYVEVIDKKDNKRFSYHIYMNHILVYKGYRFYQASYDPDGKGSILAVSYDPGMYITYLGYFLFSVAFIITALYRKGRFANYIKKIRNPSVIALLFLSSISYSSSAFNLKKFAEQSEHISKQFSQILVQHNGRIEPMDTLDLDIVHKLTGKSRLLGLNYNQIILGMVAFPDQFKKIPIIHISNPKIRSILKIKGKYASYQTFMKKNIASVFLKEIYNALHTPPPKRTQIQRDWLKINELVYISYLVYTSDIIKIFPSPNAKQQNYRWYSPYEIEQLAQKGKIDPYGAMYYLKIYGKLIRALKHLNTEQEREAIDEIYNIQKKYSGEILPSPTKIRCEIVYNHLQIFPRLIGVYTLLGLLAILIGFFEVLNGKKYKKTENLFFGLGLLALLVHSGNMILRWYIAGHAPWSDAYESIVFIAWSAAFGSVLFFRKSLLSLGGGLFVAGMFMMVANLDNINPQITNMVPVLNSYWLLIHVAFSIISYGFLAIGAILGFINLILFALKNIKPLKPQIDRLNDIAYISLYIGLALLSIGTIFGAVWANESWGAYWSWDPKETWSLISILVYALVVHKGIMYKPDKDGFVFSLLAFLSFFFVLMTYFGVNFYIAQGLHSYGRGSGSLYWFYVLELGIASWFVAVIVTVLKGTLEKAKTTTVNH